MSPRRIPSRPLRNYLRSTRKRAGLTQDDLALLMGGRGAKMISRYERFEREPMLPAALALEVALGTPVRELFAGLHAEAKQRVRERAKVMELRFRRSAGSGRTQSGRETIRRILGTDAPDE